jgi:hypothetical protein
MVLFSISAIEQLFFLLIFWHLRDEISLSSCDMWFVVLFLYKISLHCHFCEFLYLYEACSEVSNFQWYIHLRRSIVFSFSNDIYYLLKLNQSTQSKYFSNQACTDWVINYRLQYYHSKKFKRAIELFLLNRKNHKHRKLSGAGIS